MRFINKALVFISAVSGTMFELEQAKAGLEAAPALAASHGNNWNVEMQQLEEELTSADIEFLIDHFKSVTDTISWRTETENIDPPELRGATLEEVERVFSALAGLIEAAETSGYFNDRIHWVKMTPGMTPVQLGWLLMGMRESRLEVERSLDGRAVEPRSDRSEEIDQLVTEGNSIIQKAEEQGHLMNWSLSWPASRMLTDAEFNRFALEVRGIFRYIRALIETKFLPVDLLPIVSPEELEERVDHIRRIADTQGMEIAFAELSRYKTPALRGRLALELKEIEKLL